MYINYSEVCQSTAKPMYPICKTGMQFIVNCICGSASAELDVCHEALRILRETSKHDLRIYLPKIEDAMLHDLEKMLASINE